MGKMRSGHNFSSKPWTEHFCPISRHK
jgi:hypothetical protein